MKFIKNYTINNPHNHSATINLQAKKPVSVFDQHGSNSRLGHGMAGIRYNMKISFRPGPL